MKKSGLFFGVEDAVENADTVLQYADHKGSGVASPRPDSDIARLARSPTFEDMLKSPSSESIPTPSSPATSKEGVHTPYKPAEPEIKSPQPQVAMKPSLMEQEVPNLFASIDEPEDTRKPDMADAHSISAAKSSEYAQYAADEAKGEAGSEPEVSKEAKEKFPEKQWEKAAEEGRRDEIDQLLKEWTTMYEKE